jgi:hypothetical protein
MGLKVPAALAVVLALSLTTWGRSAERGELVAQPVLHDLVDP